MHQYATFWMRTLDWDGNHFLHLMRGFLTHEFNFEGPSAMSFSTSTANVGTLRICAIPLGPIRPIAVTRGLCSNHGDYGGCGVRCTLTDSKNSRVRLFDTPFSAMRPPLTSESLISFFFFLSEMHRPLLFIFMSRVIFYILSFSLTPTCRVGCFRSNSRNPRLSAFKGSP